MQRLSKLSMNLILRVISLVAKSISFDGTNIWAANYKGNSLTEFNASSGNWVATLTGSNFFSPDALTIFTNNIGKYIWVVNGLPDNNKPVLLEINVSTGMLVNSVIDRITNQWELGDPDCIVTVGNNIWVADANALEFNASNGVYIRTAIGGTPGAGTCISYSNGYFWIANGDNKQLLEYNATTGRYVKTINNVPFTRDLVFNGTNVFAVSNYPIDSIREYSASTGAFIGTIYSSNMGYNEGISRILVAGTHLWVANYTANTVKYFSI